MNAMASAQAAAAAVQRTESRVRLACQDWVRDRLKAPGTAKFVRGSTETGRMTDTTRWVSRGAVDAENSFGATLRNRYECVALVTGGGTTITPERVTVD